MKIWIPVVALASVACSSSGTWRQVETPNFVLRTDLGSSDAKHAAVALEVTRDALVSAAWPSYQFGGEKTEVYVLANGLDFERYFGHLTGGLFLHGGTPQFFLYGSADRWELRRSAHVPTRSVLRHEMTHDLSMHVWPRQPRWFAEGLADFLEPVYYAEDENNVIIGGVNYDAYHQYRNVRTIKVQDALAWNRGGLEGMAQREAAGLYGISWLLFHWLFNRHPDELLKYIDALQKGATADEALRTALPNMDFDAIDKELYEYQRHGQFDELARPLVETKISEANLQDRRLSGSEIEQVKEVLANASKRNSETHHDASESSAEGARARPAIDYAKLPMLPQYPCDARSKESAPGQVAQAPEASSSGDTQPASSRTGARPSKKTADDGKSTDKPGKLDPVIIQRLVRASYGKFRRCYEDGLKKDTDLGGKVTVRFVIGRDGSVTNVSPSCTSLPDPDAVKCVVDRYRELKFPKPDGGIVTVVYPIMFSPED